MAMVTSVEDSVPAFAASATVIPIAKFLPSQPSQLSRHFHLVDLQRFVQNPFECREVSSLWKMSARKLPRFKAWYIPPTSSARGGLGMDELSLGPRFLQSTTPSVSSKRLDPVDGFQWCSWTILQPIAASKSKMVATRATTVVIQMERGIFTSLNPQVALIAFLHSLRQQTVSGDSTQFDCRLRYDWRLAILLAMICFIIAGCGNSNKPGSPNNGTVTAGKEATERPLGKMKLMVRRNQWNEALSLVDLVRQKYSDDSDALTLAARVAHENKRPNLSADLLAEACQADDFKSDGKIQQAMVAMTSTGRFFDGLTLLQQAVERSPESHQSRRMLYDLLMGAEDRVQGHVHGRVLIQQRKFDLPLLISLSNTVRRSMDPLPLEQMVERNPSDKRPLIGKARILMDDAKFAEAVALLEEIVAAHPNFAPAIGMLSLGLAQLGRFEDLEQQSDQITKEVAGYPRYWLALGAWSEANEDAPAAARCYWEAVRCDPDWLVPWSRLLGSLQTMWEDGSKDQKQAIQEVKRITSLLGQFNQARARFDKTGQGSRELATEMAGLLRDLGRLWEAEAWVSIAATLPPDETVDIEGIRKSILTQLRTSPPWYAGEPWIAAGAAVSRSEGSQPIESWSGLLDALPLNPLGLKTSGEGSQDNSSDQGVENDVQVVLVNEAKQRGLDFFGRTGDHLDQPGIKLHQTLGCGGGTIDFDRDGWPDLYLAAAGGTPGKSDSSDNALMRNEGGSFRNVTPLASASNFGFGQGIAIGDVNEDGFPDVFVLNYGPNALLINQGDGTFEDQTATWIKMDKESTWSTSGAIADLDLDGISDLVVVNYCAGLTPVTVQCPTDDPKVIRSCTPVLFDAEPDQFYQGTATGGFVDQTSAWNAVPEIPGRGLGLTVGCFDAEPGIDLLVANDMTANHFWKVFLDEGQLSLAESALPRGLAFDDESRAQGSMGIATQDLDQDGRVDFYVTNFDGEYNTLAVQRSNGLWRDQTHPSNLAEITRPLVGFGTEAVDFDHNGRSELIVTNGHVDLFNRGEEKSVYAQPMQVFSSDTGGKYRLVTTGKDASEYQTTPHVGRALWTLDADCDGHVDLAVTHQTEPVALLMNRSSQKQNSLTVSLTGVSCSRDAVGATVTVTVDSGVSTGHLTSGDGYLCSNERVIHFSPDPFAKTVLVTVQWPDGTSDVHEGDLSKGLLHVTQGRGLVWRRYQKFR